MPLPHLFYHERLPATTPPPKTPFYRKFQHQKLPHYQQVLRARPSPQTNLDNPQHQLLQ